MVRLSNTTWQRRVGQQNVGQDTYAVMGPSCPEDTGRRNVLIGLGQIVQIQGTNIRHYYNYILARAKAYRDTRIDWVREGGSRLKRQSVDKGLLRETESVQSQISNLLKCDVSLLWFMNCMTGLTKFHSSLVPKPRMKSRYVLSGYLLWIS